MIRRTKLESRVLKFKNGKAADYDWRDDKGWM